MDKKYWNDYYANDGGPVAPSTFARFCLENFISPNSNIIELGYGNGRDLKFFLKNNHNVIGIDQNDVIYKSLKKSLKNQNGLNLICGDFTNLDFTEFPDVNIFYSRFTMHSILAHEEDRLLKNIYDVLKPNAHFLIEARTTKDPIYGKGEKIQNDIYRSDHFRRFLDAEYFKVKVENMGYSLKYFEENNNLSIYKDDNPYLMRIVLSKRDL